MKRAFLLSGLLLLALSAGCATTNDTKMVECTPGYDCPSTAPQPWQRAIIDRGAADLQCAPQTVEVTDDDSGAYEARGCGKHVLYVWNDENGLQRTSFVEPLDQALLGDGQPR